MTDRRCPSSRAQLEATQAVVTEPDVLTYLSRSLRLRAGAQVEFFDGMGGARRAELTRLTKERIEGSWLEPLRLEQRPNELAPVPILARQKRHGEDDALAALSALGFPLIRVFQADRDQNLSAWGDKQRLRWARITQDSCRQSGGYWCARVEPFESLGEAIEDLEYVVYGDAAGAPLTHRVEDRLGVVVGPEGGLSAQERALLDRRGGRGVRLGERTLRARHAASLLPAVVMNHWWQQP